MTVLCGLISWFYVLLSFDIHFRLVFRKTSKLPPGPVGLPVAGSLFQFGHMLNESLARLSNQYGPLMTVRLGLTTMVVLSSAEMVEELLQKHDQDFAAGPRWMQPTRVCNNELFTPKNLEAVRGLQEEKGRSVDIGHGVFSTALNFISNTLFLENVVDLESEFA
ncbi:Geraniol 8-hydroxylase [Nymphaea thermarum]|nr:Geraniol 8-hydroxylase [Nymphaea thermarum]